MNGHSLKTDNADADPKSGHSAGARLYHNNTNWQLSYRLIGYPNGPNVETRYGMICGTNVIMTFKVECWAPSLYQIQHYKQTVGPNYGDFGWLLFAKG